MFKILDKQYFSPAVVRLDVHAPLIARSRKAGHFVIVRTGEGGERIPLTIADADPATGRITLVIQAVGVSTKKICALEPGDCLTDVVGPLGRATDIHNRGTVVCCGGGVGEPIPAKDYFDNPGDHADELETSVMMHYHPDLVKLDEAGSGRAGGFAPDSLRTGVAWIPRRWDRVSRDTGIGSPDAAAADKGARFAADVAADYAQLLRDLLLHDLYRPIE